MSFETNFPRDMYSSNTHSRKCLNSAMFFNKLSLGYRPHCNRLPNINNFLGYIAWCPVWSSWEERYSNPQWSYRLCQLHSCQPGWTLRAFCLTDNTVKVWELSSGKEGASFMGNRALNCCAVTFDRVTFVVGEIGEQIHFLRLEGVDSGIVR